MKSKHTEGPWRPEFSNGHARVIAGIEHEVAHVPQLRSTNPEIDQNRDVMVANARLISAAPDLLDALVDLVQVIDALGTQGGERMTKARAAIAKARGE